ncbi:MAG: Fe-S cluster assembly protein HesB [Pseudomonadota bacterium]
MIKISDNALEQIKFSAEQTNMQGIPLRIAIKEQQDGSFHYAMGFDEQRLPGDNFVNIDDVSLVISSASKDLAEGMTLDFAELETGKPEFIFLNPNDPTFVPPKKGRQ